MRVKVGDIDVGSLRPMSEADIWGYYDGSMPTILVFDKLKVPYVVQYDRKMKGWCTVKHPKILLYENMLIGWISAPTIEDSI